MPLYSFSVQYYLLQFTVHPFQFSPQFQVFFVFVLMSLMFALLRCLLFLLCLYLYLITLLASRSRSQTVGSFISVKSRLKHKRNTTVSAHSSRRFYLVGTLENLNQRNSFHQLRNTFPDYKITFHGIPATVSRRECRTKDAGAYEYSSLLLSFQGWIIPSTLLYPSFPSGGLMAAK